MRYWKPDYSKTEVREVEADGVGEYDDEDEKVYTNSHFTEYDAAVASLKTTALSAVVSAGRRVQNANSELERANIESGLACAAYEEITHKYGAVDAGGK